MTNHPLRNLIEKTGSVVIDGAMSTALEKLGCDLNDKLWSAKVLLEEPEKILQVHRDYFAAGANVGITATYQATEAGFAQRGIDAEKSRALIQLAVKLFDQAKAEFLQTHPHLTPDMLLSAGAVGPYGAFLANGAEYTGAYDLTEAEYRKFHQLRMQALVDGGADFLALETMPKFVEIAVLLKMIEELDTTAWVTVTLKDEGHISDGTPIEKVAEICESSDRVDAVGVNCVKRELVSEALRKLASVTKKPLIVYPNSGETYDPTTKQWHHPVDNGGWSGFVKEWHSLGALCIGGCCRTLPSDIVQIAELMKTYRKA